ncbi:MAG: hypothetical protein JO128_03190, partial [Alphaproteobacteria bacterium]|nr:hypothetical protein [Alphaproteobacteria bacterium]
MLPARLRERLAASERRLVVRLEAGRALLGLESHDLERGLGGIDVDPGAEPSGALHDILRRHDLAAALDQGTLAGVLRLPPDQALRTTIALPAAA